MQKLTTILWLSFNYRSVTGKLNYLGQNSHGDILFATHQIAKYSSHPSKEHGGALGFNATMMQISQEIGTETVHKLTLVQ